MDFLKNLFKDDEMIVGLSGFKNFSDKPQSPKKVKQRYINIFVPDYNAETLVFTTNIRENFLLS